MDRDKLIVRFGYDGDNTEITDLGMDISCNASPMELLCAGIMFQRFAVVKFTELALKSGEAKEDVDSVVSKLFELIDRIHDPNAEGDAQ